VYIRRCMGEDSLGPTPILCICMLFNSVVWLHGILTLRIGVVELGC